LPWNANAWLAMLFMTFTPIAPLSEEPIVKDNGGTLSRALPSRGSVLHLTDCEVMKEDKRQQSGGKCTRLKHASIVFRQLNWTCLLGEIVNEVGSDSRAKCTPAKCKTSIVRKGRKRHSGIKAHSKHSHVSKSNEKAKQTNHSRNIGG